MSHERKKGGQRKDKKVERLRKDLEQRAARAKPKAPQTDQHDLQTFKPGAPSDKLSPQRRPRPDKKKN